MALWTTALVGNKDEVSKWLLRALVTLILAVSWHFFTAKEKPRGNQLEDAWEPPSERRQKWLESLETQQRQENANENETRDEDKDDAQEDGTWVKVSKDASTMDESSEKPSAATAAPKTERKKQIAPRARRSRPLRRRPTPPTPADRPPMTSISNDHPGIQPFRRWYDIEASLYRIYVVGRVDGTPVVCPFVPKSERGHVKVELEVTNRTSGPMDVFWVDYKGKEVYKGSAAPGQAWYQTTWIGHPWTFRGKDGKLLFNYIPYKICPTTDAVRTVSPNDPNVGQYRFEVADSTAEKPHEACHIVDPVFPTDISTPTDAMTWSLQHMSRFWPHAVNSSLLTKYLTNILLHPADVKYRQIRIANKTFFHEVWNTPCRGVLLAAGFQERGAYAELGSSQELPSNVISDISAVVLRLRHWQAQQEGSTYEAQPEGALDGYGRAGFGRAGQMNL